MNILQEDFGVGREKKMCTVLEGTNWSLFIDDVIFLCTSRRIEKKI